MVKNKPTARLENWEIGGGRNGEYFLWGEVYEHPEFKKQGNQVRTSKIRVLNLVDKLCETQNTNYVLGKYKHAF